MVYQLQVMWYQMGYENNRDWWAGRDIIYSLAFAFMKSEKQFKSFNTAYYLIKI
jgi:hypothetical protein